MAEIKLRGLTETVHLLEDKMGKIFEVIGIGKHFLNRTPVAQEIVPRINESH